MPQIDNLWDRLPEDLTNQILQKRKDCFNVQRREFANVFCSMRQRRLANLLSPYGHKHILPSAITLSGYYTRADVYLSHRYHMVFISFDDGRAYVFEQRIGKKKV